MQTQAVYTSRTPTPIPFPRVHAPIEVTYLTFDLEARRVLFASADRDHVVRRTRSATDTFGLIASCDDFDNPTAADGTVRECWAKRATVFGART